MLSKLANLIGFYNWYNKHNDYVVGKEYYLSGFLQYNKVYKNKLVSNVNGYLIFDVSRADDQSSLEVISSWYVLGPVEG